MRTGFRAFSAVQMPGGVRWALGVKPEIDLERRTCVKKDDRVAERPNRGVCVRGDTLGVCHF